ncbi:MAG TPA: twin-arginine translocase TatA/TatE family subunit [Stellaceae bacterium]|jgi:sec-independent protein translocase protein TatA|nr:twin-arginine translocase TatA/TatE family subunit [Stellaceae bacterium]
MGGLSLWHWLVIIAVVAVLFGGKGKISNLMGDFAKGIKAFKSGMKEEETAGTTPPQVPPPATTAAGAAADRPVHDRG